MAFKKYSRKFKGYVKIKVEGFFSERFINLCMAKNIDIWDIDKDEYEIVFFKVAISHFKKLKSIARISKCKIKIIEKVGVPFLVFKYRKRKVFAFSFLFVIFLMIASTMFIWEVEVLGDFPFSIEDINKELAGENIFVGSFKKNIDLDQAKLNMALKRDDLAWIGISIKGNKAVIEIVPKILLEDNSLDDLPCNLVSDKDGVVHKIYVANGVAMVSEGDTVTKGQILISGIVTSEHANSRVVHADGEVLLKTWHSHKVTVPFERDIVFKTGNNKSCYVISLGNWKINLLNSGTNYEKYDTIVKENDLVILDTFVIPVNVKKITYEEIRVDSLVYTAMQAEATAKNIAMRELSEILPHDVLILDNSVVTHNFDDFVEVMVTTQCIEKAGTIEELEGEV